MGQLEQPLVLHPQGQLTKTALFLLLSMLDLKIAVALDDCLEDFMEVLLVAWKLRVDVKHLMDVKLHDKV